MKPRRRVSKPEKPLTLCQSSAPFGFSLIALCSCSAPHSQTWRKYYLLFFSALSDYYWLTTLSTVWGKKWPTLKIFRLPLDAFELWRQHPLHPKTVHHLQHPLALNATRTRDFLLLFRKKIFLLSPYTCIVLCGEREDDEKKNFFFLHNLQTIHNLISIHTFWLTYLHYGCHLIVWFIAFIIT